MEATHTTTIDHFNNASWLDGFYAQLQKMEMIPGWIKHHGPALSSEPTFEGF